MKRPRISPLLAAACLSLALGAFSALAGGPAYAAGRTGGDTKKPLGPIVIPSAPPLDDPRKVPYPVYGATPIPGVGPGAKKIDGVAANLSLLDAIAVAIARSPVLAAARQDVELARVNVMFTAAPAEPNLGVTYSHTATQRQDQGLTPFTFTTVPTREHPFGEQKTIFIPSNVSAFNTTAAAFLTQLIYDGGKTGYLIRSAYKSQLAQSQTYKRQLQTTVNATTTAYYSTLQNQRLMLVNISIVRLFKELEEFAQGERAAGKADVSDIASIEEQDLIQQFQTVKAQNDYVTSQTAFANAMGLDGYADVLPLDDAPLSDQLDGMRTLEPPSYERALARALLLRGDYLAAVNDVEAAVYGMKSAHRMTLPTVSVTGSSSTFSNTDNAGNFRNNAVIGVTGTLPLFDQGNTVATRANAQATYDQAVATLDVARQQVQTDVQTAVTTLAGARAALVVAHQMVRKAAEEMATRKALYKTGDTQISDLLDALTTYADALTQEAVSIFDVRLAEQAYYLAVGENS